MTTERVLLEPHAHTSESSPCGQLPGAELVRQLKEAGYGAVVIVDHMTPGRFLGRQGREAFLAGYRAAKEAGDALGVAVLPGMEIQLKDKPEEYLVYGMEEEEILALPDSVCGESLSDLHDRAKAAGWRIYQAHPYRAKMQPAHTAFIDGVEIFNGNPRHNSQNRLAAKFASMHLLHTISGSDVHRQGDVGLVGLQTPRSALTPKAFAQWLADTPRPRVQYQEAPVDGIRYTVGAIPRDSMLQALYQDAGWTSYCEAMGESMKGILGSARVVCAWDDTTLVGMARVISDGYTIAYVQDILVLGICQRRGIGRELLRRVLLPYRDVRQTVLITDDTAQTSAFYQACGFENISAYKCAGFIRIR